MINEVNAQSSQITNNASTNTTDNNWWTSKMDLIDILDVLLKIIYILLWPLLVVAWTALDNSLVYWSFLHLDAPLRKFWNIIKNFANFTLGFLVLRAIIQNVFSFGSKSEKRQPQKVIIKTLIAWVLIQASRFLTAAVIDISTIATYAIWWLPLSVLKNTDIWNQKILTTNSNLKMNKFLNDLTPTSWNNQVSDPDNYFSVRYSLKTNDGTEISLSDCRTQTWYILWRKDWDSKFNNWKTFGNWINACVIFGSQIVIFNEMPWAETKDRLTYPVNITDHLNLTDWYDKAEACNYIIKIRWEKTKTKCADQIPNAPSYGYGLDGWKKRLDWQTQTATLWTLIDKSKWFVWPLVTIYSSMLNFAQISDTSIQRWTSATIIELFVKFWVAVGLFFPLIALTLVLITRIGLLRMVVATSPFIIMLHVFKDQLWEKLWGEHLKLNNILKIIFAPVITVFALSISLVFMSVLISWLNNRWSDNSATANSQTITKSFWFDCTTWQSVQSCSTMNGNVINIEGTNNFSRSWTLDLFSRLIVNLMAIWLMRFILFASFKYSWKIWESIWKGVWTLWANLLKTVPIVPVWAWWSKVWLGTLFDVGKTVPGKITESINRKQETNIMEKINQITWEWKTQTTTEKTWTSILTPDKGEELAKGLALPNANITQEIQKINEKTNKQEEKINNFTLTNTTNLDNLWKWIDNLEWDKKTQALENAVNELKKEIEEKAGKEDIEKIVNQKDNIIVTEYLKDNLTDWKDNFEIKTKDNEFTIKRDGNKFKVEEKEKKKEEKKDDNKKTD